MNGMEKIIAQILADAEPETERILQQAAAEAEAIQSEAVREAEKQESDRAARARAREESFMDQARLAARQHGQRLVLAEKQRLIAQLLEEAQKTLLAKPDGEYFSWIETVLKRHAGPQEGAICFCARDLERLPEGFEARIRRIAEENGGSLTLKREPRPIDGGFVLVYGGVEENCSVSALFAALRGELTDRVHRMLLS